MAQLATLHTGMHRLMVGDTKTNPGLHCRQTWPLGQTAQFCRGGGETNIAVNHGDQAGGGFQGPRCVGGQQYSSTKRHTASRHSPQVGTSCGSRHFRQAQIHPAQKSGLEGKKHMVCTLAARQCQASGRVRGVKQLCQAGPDGLKAGTGGGQAAGRGAPQRALDSARQCKPRRVAASASLPRTLHCLQLPVGEHAAQLALRHCKPGVRGGRERL